MKKSIFIFTAAFILSWQTPKKERTYTLTIPEHLAGAYWQVLNGQPDNITIAQAKELYPLLINQMQQQAIQFHIQDSIAAAKLKTKP